MTLDTKTGELLPSENERRRAVEALRTYHEGRETESAGRQAKDYAARIIKGWLEANPGETLYDREHNLSAFLQNRTGTPEMDVASLAKANATLLAWAGEHGLLKLDVAAWKAMQGKGIEMQDLKGFVAQMGGSVALQVKKGD